MLWKADLKPFTILWCGNIAAMLEALTFANNLQAERFRDQWESYESQGVVQT